MRRRALAALLTAAVTPAPAGEAPAVAHTLVRPAATPDVAPPERRFTVEREGKRATDYEIRLRLAEPPAAPITGQTVTCRARLSNDRLFEFAYRDQTIPAGRTETDSYLFSVPDNAISLVRCIIGPWPGA